MFSNIANVQFQGGIYTQYTQCPQITQTFSSADPIEKLYRAAALRAIHSHERKEIESPTCHVGTRESILEQLEAWVRNEIDEVAPMTWLTGCAASGKTCIAHSFSERCASRGYLLGNFSFSSDDTTRASIKSFPPTIAYQLAQSHCLARRSIEAAIQEEPWIFHLQFEEQLNRLVLAPLRHISAQGIRLLPQVIIIDGLDECQDSSATRRLIHSCRDLIAEMDLVGIQLRVLVTSRSPKYLRKSFQGVSASISISRLKIKPDLEGVERFLSDMLQEIKDHDPSIPSSWPPPGSIQTLVASTGGQFACAQRAIRSITSGRHHPVRALEIVLGIHSSIRSGSIPVTQVESVFSHLQTLEVVQLVLSARLVISAFMKMNASYRVASRVLSDQEARHTIYPTRFLGPERFNATRRRHTA